MVKDTDNFLEAMHDVQPIKVKKRVALDKAALDKHTVAARQHSAQKNTVDVADPLTNAQVDMLEANAVLAFQRPGVQHGVYKQLRLGKYRIEARLDLHRLKLEQARQSVYGFVRDCIDNNIRCALITHGKGEGRSTPALLKSYVAYWLPQMQEVLAFHSAQKHHGGTGATYLMLKKSDEKRRENFERHSKR